MTQLKPIRLYGDDACPKTRLYQEALQERGVDFIFRNVAQNPDAAFELRALFTDGELKFPTLVMKGKIVRNPPLYELDRILARLEIYDPGLVHEPAGNRFVRYMLPKDAFVSYSLKNERITLTHIEIPSQHRGTGLGARLALEVFPLVKEMGLPARITCSFMRKVAASRPEWALHFGLAPSS